MKLNDVVNKVKNYSLKVGISFLEIIKSTVFILSPRDIDIRAIDTYPEPALAPVPIPMQICHIVWSISIILFIVTGLFILITKIKFRKLPEPKKIKKWIKIIFIISIIIFILSTLIKLIV